jgi:phospholipid/cholesterol/gamma-HCH transport system substrate-binding protein
MITRRVWIQLAIFIVVSITGLMVMSFGYLRLPDLLFGVGHYQVTVELPAASGLYHRSNVTYLGTEVGTVKEVRLTDNGGVTAVLSLRSDVKIPSDLEAEVHSVSAVGEQYVALLPRRGNAAPLKNGDIIPVKDTRVPPDLNALLDATNRGLQAIPGDNLKTAIDEAYIAFAGLGPEISRFVKGSTRLSIDARKNLGALTNVVDNVGPVLDTQTDTSNSVQAWAAHLATITQQLQAHDNDVAGALRTVGPAAGEVQRLFDRLQPTLPILLANLTSVGKVAVTYRPNIEQLLVLVPEVVADFEAITVANRDTKQPYRGAFLSFNLNLNIPPPCSTGFLPIQQQRPAALEDAPEVPAGDLYCRVPQDSPFNVRGARNTPCETRPGKRAPTVKMCESDENYVPLNDGFNWKGDPNGTLSGQGVPQQRLGSPPAQNPAQSAPPPDSLPMATYDPATGTYVGPDGHVYTQSDLGRRAGQGQTWQKMLLPPQGN